MPRSSRSEEEAAAAGNPGHAQPAGSRSADRHLSPAANTGSRNAAHGVQDAWAQRHVLFKGGHGEGEIVRDVLVDGGRTTSWPLKSPRQDTRHTHGTGCTLATAIACGLAQRRTLADAVRPRACLCAERDPDRAGVGRRAHGPLNNHKSCYESAVISDDRGGAVTFHHGGGIRRRIDDHRAAAAAASGSG